MIRILGLSVAAGVTCVAATGIAAIIAIDFVGIDGLARFWNSAAGGNRPAVADISLAGAAGGGADDLATFKPEKEIHFFEDVPIAGTKLSVSTGAAYANVAAVEAKNPLRQWCYLSLPERDGITGRVDLGSQFDAGQPVLARAGTFNSAELTPHGLTPERLIELARSHCRFNRLDPLG